MYKWIIIPGIIYTLLFIVAMVLFSRSANDAVTWLSTQLNIEPWLEKERNSLLSFLFVMMGIMLRMVLFLFYFSLFKYLILIIGSPVFAYLSEKTEAIIENREHSFNWKQLLPDAMRGAKLALRNAGWQTVYKSAAEAPRIPVALLRAFWMLLVPPRAGLERESVEGLFSMLGGEVLGVATQPLYHLAASQPEQCRLGGGRLVGEICREPRQAKQVDTVFVDDRSEEGGIRLQLCGGAARLEIPRIRPSRVAESALAVRVDVGRLFALAERVVESERAVVVHHRRHCGQSPVYSVILVRALDHDGEIGIEPVEVGVGRFAPPGSRGDAYRHLREHARSKPRDPALQLEMVGGTHDIRLVPVEGEEGGRGLLPVEAVPGDRVVVVEHPRHQCLAVELPHQRLDAPGRAQAFFDLPADE